MKETEIDVRKHPCTPGVRSDLVRSVLADLGNVTSATHHNSHEQLQSFLKATSNIKIVFVFFFTKSIQFCSLGSNASVGEQSGDAQY